MVVDVGGDVDVAVVAGGVVERVGVTDLVGVTALLVLAVVEVLVDPGAVLVDRRGPVVGTGATGTVTSLRPITEIPAGELEPTLGGLSGAPFSITEGSSPEPSSTRCGPAWLSVATTTAPPTPIEAATQATTRAVRRPPRRRRSTGAWPVRSIRPSDHRERRDSAGSA